MSQPPSGSQISPKASSVLGPPPMSGIPLLHSPTHSVFNVSNKAQYISLLSHASYNPSQTPWIVDLGATDHMVCDATPLTSVFSKVNSVVRLPNGESAPITHKGTIHITEHLILSDVLVVPSFTFNLISASKLTKTMGYCLIILAGLCFIQALPTWMKIALARECDGLFYLSPPYKPPFKFRKQNLEPSVTFPADCKAHSAKSHVSSLSCNDFDIWHYRLGHLSKDRLSSIGKFSLEVDSSHDKHCTVCPLAKQK